MKLFALATFALAAKDPKWDRVAKRGGKHGRLHVDNPGQDRLLLHYPICMTNRESPLCDKTCVKNFDQESGRIKIKNYESFRSCLWTINVPATHSISFQFVDDFNLEYHQRCGFDRVHIFSGGLDGDTQRQGRFCGPKPNGNKPFDGSKRNVETNGVMPFWDIPFDIQSNKAIIGFDSDQSFVGGGFTLVWNSHKIHDYDFTYVFEAHEFVSIQAEYLFGSVMFGSDKDKKKYKKKLEGKIIKASRRALSNNPGSQGDKRRKCAVSEQQPVSPAIVKACEALVGQVDDMTADFRDAMNILTMIINEYLDDCMQAGTKWPKRVSEFADEVSTKRIL